MTNAELLAKIKAEIERRKSLLIQHSKLTYNLILETFIKEYDDLLSFLSTLESEHLADARKTLEIKPGDEVTINCHKIVYNKDKGYVTIVKSAESVPNDLEEMADNYEQEFFTDATLGEAFIAGAKWQKEQMMKEAVEGVIDDCGTPARLRLEMPGGSFRIGDKVRVIVLPKEGGK